MDSLVVITNYMRIIILVTSWQSLAQKWKFILIYQPLQLQALINSKYSFYQQIEKAYILKFILLQQ